MKSFIKLFGIIAFIAIIGLSMTACHMNLPSGRGYSIQVNNQAAGRSIAPTDTVELYIHHFEYQEDANNRALIIIANGDRTQGSKGGILNNAGWYSVTANLDVTNDVNNGPYSSFLVGISKLRVNGNEYNFPPTEMNDGVIFGKPTPRWNGGRSDYPNNFNGITVTSSTFSIKTVLTVEPGIIGTPGSTGYNAQGLATDPYSFIKVAGRINE